MNFKKIIPHLIAVIVFAAITMVYFSPLLDGKSIRQGDIVQHVGMSKEIADYRDKTGDEALWTNSMFGGMPAFQISTIYKNNLMQYVDKMLMLNLPHPAGLVFLCLLGFYFLMIMLGADALIAGIGAIMFAFSSYFFIIIDAGHNSKAHAIAYMAPVVAGVLLTYRGKILLGAAITALALSLEIYCNHLQITYYLAFIVLAIGLFEGVKAIKNKTLPAFSKASVFLGLAAILAVGPNISSLWSTYEYGKETIRGRSELTPAKSGNPKADGLDIGYATQWSYGVGETFSLMVPNFKGGSSSIPIGEDKAALEKADPQFRQYIANVGQYFGDKPFTSGPVYVGSIVCFLFVLGLFIIKDGSQLWILGVTVLSIMLSWGKNFMPLTEFFFNVIPGYNKFRTVEMILVIVEFTMPFLAILTLKKIIETPNVLENKKPLYIALLVTAGLSFLFAIAPSAFNSFLQDGEYQQVSGQLKQAGLPDGQIAVFIKGIEDARASIFSSDALRSLLFILLGAAAIWAYAANKIKREFVLVAVAVFVLADMWSVDKRYLNNTAFVPKNQMKQPFQSTAADEQILMDKDLDYRVMNLTVSTFQNATTSYHHKSIGGYHGAKLKRYNELIEYQISKNNMAVLNMLNTRYFIVPDRQTNQPVVQRNTEALGNAWFVKEYKLVANADSEINALTNFNPAQTAIVDKRFAEQASAFKGNLDSTASIKLTNYEPNYLAYESKANVEQLAMFSEIYYDKGWNAFIDGKPAPYFRANYVLRAMIIPAGTHKIEYRFEPKSFYTGEKIALASSCILLLLVAGGIYVEVKKGKEDNA